MTKYLINENIGRLNIFIEFTVFKIYKNVVGENNVW